MTPLWSPAPEVQVQTFDVATSATLFSPATYPVITATWPVPYTATPLVAGSVVRY